MFERGLSVNHRHNAAFTQGLSFLCHTKKGAKGKVSTAPGITTSLHTGDNEQWVLKGGGLLWSESKRKADSESGSDVDV